MRDSSEASAVGSVLKQRHGYSTSVLVCILLVFTLALALRLLVWHWREFYPLGGDEQEYFQQALTLLQQHRYDELRLMRPPLYGVFLALCIRLVDSLVQNLRLVQAVISALTVIPVWLLTAELFAGRKHGGTPRGVLFQAACSPAAVAALLCALSYTLAVSATELLTETLFLFGLTVLFWLLVRVGRSAQLRPYSAAASGVVLGTLCLTRSVAFILLPLGALWLLAAHGRSGFQAHPYQFWRQAAQRLIIPVLPFGVATCLVILPWTVRNYVTYGGLILIDTTGAENLWLDNDPAGREAVKAQLYMLGDDRLARQRIAAERGLAAITSDPQRFVWKAWGELLTFFALEYTDDMRERRAIWIPPAELWARLVLGDGLWLLVLLAGVMGFCTAPGTRNQELGNVSRFADPRWLVGAWGGYTLLTAVIFHVELRYRLPLYPVLLPYAAWMMYTLSPRVFCWHTFRLQSPLPGHAVQERGAAVAGDHPMEASAARVQAAAKRTLVSRFTLCTTCFALCALIVLLMLLHQPYPVLAWQLGRKHVHLAHAEWALAQGDAATAADAAQSALKHDPESTLARVALARAARLQGDEQSAEVWLREAIKVLPAHPYAHLLLGDMLRQEGQMAEARREFAYETASLQDLQAWSRQWFRTGPPSALDVGNGLDLGFVQDFHAAESAPGGVVNWRWTKGDATVQLALPAKPDLEGRAPCSASVPTIGAGLHAVPSVYLVLRLSSGRTADTPPPGLEVRVDEQLVGHMQLARDWQDYVLPLPMDPMDAVGNPLTIRLHSDTFTPRDYDRSSNDGRMLGIMVDRVELIGCSSHS